MAAVFHVQLMFSFFPLQHTGMISVSTFHGFSVFDFMLFSSGSLCPSLAVYYWLILCSVFGPLLPPKFPIAYHTHVFPPVAPLPDLYPCLTVAPSPHLSEMKEKEKERDVSLFSLHGATLLLCISQTKAPCDDWSTLLPHALVTARGGRTYYKDSVV